MLNMDIWSKNEKGYGAATLCVCLGLIVTEKIFYKKEKYRGAMYTCAEPLHL